MTPFEKNYKDMINFSHNLSDHATLVGVLKIADKTVKEIEKQSLENPAIRPVTQEEIEIMLKNSYDSYFLAMDKYIGQIDFIGVA